MELSALKSKHTALQSDYAKLNKAHEDAKLELDAARRKVQRLRAKDEQETSALNDMVERIEKNLLSATRRAQAAEERVAELERQAGRDRDASDQASLNALGDEESRQLLKFYRGRLRMCEESGADFSRRLSHAMRVVHGAMTQISTQADDMKTIADTLKTFGRISLVESDADRPRRHANHNQDDDDDDF